MDYDFTFVVSGVDVDDQAAVDALLEKCDALLARAGGVDLLSTTGSGGSAVEAALAAASAARAAVPRLRVCRLDRDLVGVHEIAERTGRSRQNVSQWIAGERKARGVPFPAAEGTVGRSQVWLWSEVNRWLAVHGLDDGVAYPTRAEMAEIDVALAAEAAGAPGPGPEEAAGAPGPGPEEAAGEPRDERASVFTEHLTRLDHTVDEWGAPVLLVTDPAEPARGVMECVSSFGHDVSLVTTADRSTVTVLSTRPPWDRRRSSPCPGTRRSATCSAWCRRTRRRPSPWRRRRGRRRPGGTLRRSSAAGPSPCRHAGPGPYGCCPDAGPTRTGSARAGLSVRVPLGCRSCPYGFCPDAGSARTGPAGVPVLPALAYP
ncbi:helix-turn-helix transcriptional regulator [Streptomyces sudanensis]|uniref:helix-turn-helix transcriptional regulator n=1 Tax=Streptomyces sudanensis TaxID=436397 RepID=UPI0020CEEF44|nr:hypothetical protein [Streptomyces sudanensis]MCQ0000887.1 hypothetical protein [Streptomyces sudanensis]